MSFSCGRVVQFVMVGPLHRKRSEGADDAERTTIRSQRERSELGQTPSKTLQPQCQPQAGARLHPTKTKTKTINDNENPTRKPQTKTVLVARFRFSCSFSFWSWFWSGFWLGVAVGVKASIVQAGASRIVVSWAG